LVEQAQIAQLFFKFNKAQAEVAQRLISKLLSSDSGAGHLSFMAPALLRNKICYKSLIFVYRKSISITAEPKKLAF